MFVHLFCSFAMQIIRFFLPVVLTNNNLNVNSAFQETQECFTHSRAKCAVGTIESNRLKKKISYFQPNTHWNVVSHVMLEWGGLAALSALAHTQTRQRRLPVCDSKVALAKPESAGWHCLRVCEWRTWRVCGVWHVERSGGKTPAGLQFHMLSTRL